MRAKLTFVFSLFALFFMGVSKVARASVIEVMSYNVENLFDTQHDEGKIDWEYLPKSHPDKERGCKEQSGGSYLANCLKTDWTDEKLKVKLAQIERIVKTERGDKIPDILLVEEIENENVAQLLANTLGYNGVLITNGPDERGIDVAVLYKSGPALTFVTHKEHVVSGTILKNLTRNILEVQFLADGQYPLTIFVNHWPSQSNPNSDRLSVAKFLRSLISERAGEGHFVLAGGDFNVVDSDHPNSIKNELTFDGTIVDVHTWSASIKQSLAERSDSPQKPPMPLGTYFFSKLMQWNILDHFFIAAGKKSSLKAIPSSYEIFAPKIATTQYTYRNGAHSGTVVTGVPKRYSHDETVPEKAGFSDHFPIVLKLQTP